MITEIGKRYAKALYETSKATGKDEAVFQELRSLGEAISKNEDLSHFFSSPTNSLETKLKVVEGALAKKVSPDFFNFLKLLSEKNRLAIISDIAAAYELINDEAHGVTRGVVKTATPLSQDERKKVEETVTKITKKKVILSFEEDSTILGGMIAQVGGWTFDDSLDSHLTFLNEKLNRRAN